MWILAARFKSSATVHRARLRPPERNYSTQTEDSEGIGAAERERVRGTEKERERGGRDGETSASRTSAVPSG